ncbi:MAG: hypothetical protein SAL07_18215 [Oscillatoria sp. PMC 1051.18]|nr:hypothetical protein [Oscillatoria sp. PMC 1050.18]MEC5031839.1 hypothetical protein [Oscillatoria sp. PMC 1051.18]
MNLMLIQSIDSETDLKQLQEIVKNICGEICWEAKLSYGDELSLEIGDKIPYSHKSMENKQKGSWRFGTRGSQWRLYSIYFTLDFPANSQNNMSLLYSSEISRNKTTKLIVTSELEPEIIKEKIKLLEGIKVSKFEVDYPDLVLKIGFNNNYELQVLPDWEDDYDLPYWELFTPDKMVLQLGVGKSWSYQRSDLPINAATEPLTGEELLKTIKEFDYLPKRKVALICGYYYVNEQNNIRVELNDFYNAVVAANNDYNSSSS